VFWLPHELNALQGRYLVTDFARELSRKARDVSSMVNVKVSFANG
jgi:hypothetical protein